MLGKVILEAHNLESGDIFWATPLYSLRDQVLRRSSRRRKRARHAAGAKLIQSSSRKGSVTRGRLRAVASRCVIGYDRWEIIPLVPSFGERLGGVAEGACDAGLLARRKLTRSSSPKGCGTRPHSRVVVPRCVVGYAQ